MLLRAKSIQEPSTVSKIPFFFLFKKVVLNSRMIFIFHSNSPGLSQRWWNPLAAADSASPPPPPPPSPTPSTMTNLPFPPPPKFPSRPRTPQFPSPFTYRNPPQPSKFNRPTGPTSSAPTSKQSQPSTPRPTSTSAGSNGRKLSTPSGQASARSWGWTSPWCGCCWSWTRCPGWTPRWGKRGERWAVGSWGCRRSWTRSYRKTWMASGVAETVDLGGTGTTSLRRWRRRCAGIKEGRRWRGFALSIWGFGACSDFCRSRDLVYRRHCFACLLCYLWSDTVYKLQTANCNFVLSLDPFFIFIVLFSMHLNSTVLIMKYRKDPLFASRKMSSSVRWEKYKR